MVLTHKIALDPTEKQKQYFARATGCDRFCWNLAVAWFRDMHACGLQPTARGFRFEFNLEKDAKYPWMAELHRDAKTDAPFRVERAWKRFFEAREQGDLSVGQPKFHKKGWRDSFAVVACGELPLQGKHIRLPRIGWIKMREPLCFAGKIVGNVTVSKQADRWFASILVEVGELKRQRSGEGIAGADWGIVHALTITREVDGEQAVEVIDAPKPLARNLKRLKRVSRKLSRRQRGSQNRKKQQKRLARLHRRIANIRTDFWHKVTTNLCRENQAIAVEELNVTGMLRNRGLARAVSDVGHSAFAQQIRYKARLYNTRLVIADRWYPSSKTCSKCGRVGEDPYRGRAFHCDWCGHEQDRDENASQNLLALAKIPEVLGEFTPAESGASKLLVEAGSTQRAEVCV